MENDESIPVAVTKKLPTKRDLLRAAVSAIPYVGGPLDHLIFDRSGEMQLENITISIEALSNRLREVEDKFIDRGWFESEEALSAMKILADKIGFEPDKEKVQTLGKVVAICGLKKNVQDKHKLQILEYIGNFSSSQIELLKIISGLRLTERKLTHQGLRETRSAIWLTSIASAIQKQTPHLLSSFMTDIEILEARNTVRRIQTVLPDRTEGGYVMTQIGWIAAKYLTTADASTS